MVSAPETNPTDFSDWSALHQLLRDAFASMDGRIDPPSSLTTMTLADVTAKAAREDLFLIRQDGAPVACLFGHAEPDCYEVGKLAVAADLRRRGLARRLIDAAADHAHAGGHGALQLYARVELVENRLAYARMGFTQHRTFTHQGYLRPTAVIFRRRL